MNLTRRALGLTLGAGALGLSACGPRVTPGGQTLFRAVDVHPAAKPPSMTGKRVGSTPACQTLREKIGPASRPAPYCWSSGALIRPSFQPAIRSGQAAIASSWIRYASAMVPGAAPG